jgi:hypothetical protein
MRVLFKHSRNQQGTLGGGHLGHTQRIDDVDVELDALRRLAVAELAQPGSPGALLRHEGAPASSTRSGPGLQVLGTSLGRCRPS